MSYIEANKNTEQRTVIQIYCLQHAQANKSCDYNDDFYIAVIIIVRPSSDDVYHVVSLAILYVLYVQHYHDVPWFS